MLEASSTRPLGVPTESRPNPLCNYPLTDTSLPSLPHPFLGDNRAYSTSSPPTSPRYPSSTSTVNPTYQSLVNGGLGAGSVPISSRLSEKMPDRSTYTPASASKEVKADNGAPRLFGIELKWIS